MIVGLGIDLVDIRRIERAMENPRFVFRILTDAERTMCRMPHCVAGRWAAKEAIAKAVGLPLTWQDVEILPDETGAPRVKISSANFDPIRLRIHVSITHEREQAAAVAALERLVMQAPHT
ncbi:MAG TPA: holo-ACP synthase, partial [Fimbriimonadaceae bacterium]|nr:holo-ACP synthase [Fimbriimonadaceae bacterium]